MKQALIVIALLLASACASAEVDVAAEPVPAAKRHTCAEAEVTTDLPALERQLVPYSKQVAGVEMTFGTTEQNVLVISGGYMDDLFEGYDDLEEVGTVTVRTREATLLEADFLGKSVRAAVWQEDPEPVPCGSHAVLAIGLSATEFTDLVATIE